jgi:hypothetical protein
MVSKWLLREPDEPSAGLSNSTPAPSQDEPTAPPSTPDNGLPAEVQEKLARLEQLEQYKQNADVLMSGSASLDPWEESARFVLADAGRTEPEIEEYIQAQRVAMEETVPDYTDDQPAQPSPTSDTPPGVGDKNPLEERIEQLEGQLRQREEARQQQDLDVMQQEMSRSMQKTLDSHSGLGVLFKKTKELAGDEEVPKSRTMLQEDLQRELMDRLRLRKAKGEQFRLSWFEDEAGKAADAVFERYRTVIGDPDKLQRVPETAPGDDRLVHTKPVEPPAFESGDDAGTVRTKVSDWNVDFLTRLAAKGGPGERSRV